jgi:hypothetical protein
MKTSVTQKTADSRRSQAGISEGRGWGDSRRTRNSFQKMATSWFVFLALILSIGPGEARELPPPTNFFNETGAAIDISDPLLDDRGPGYYQYPLNREIPRGAYDLKRFTVYEEGDVLTFVIQMREYILTDTRTSKYGADQGFIGQTFDIYIDTDNKPDSGYTKALPARHIKFADRRGWERMILITPLSHYRVYDLLKNKTDDLEFQNWIPDLIFPDYVQIQRDKLIVRINKESVGKGDPAGWGYQVFVMGFSPIVAANQLFNMDVRAFAGENTIGGGWDTHGDPPILDCIVPEDADQKTLLREYRSEPYHGDIECAVLPFVQGRNPENTTRNKPMAGNGDSRRPSQPVGMTTSSLLLPSAPEPLIESQPLPFPPPVKVAAPVRRTSRGEVLAVQPPNIEFSDSGDSRFPPVVKSTADLGLSASPKKAPPTVENAFIPIKSSPLAKPVSAGAKAKAKPKATAKTKTPTPVKMDGRTADSGFVALSNP